MTLRQRSHDHLVRLRTAAVHEHVISVEGQHHRVKALRPSRQCPTKHEAGPDDELRLDVEDSVDGIFGQFESGPVQGRHGSLTAQLGRHEVVGPDSRHVGRQDSAVGAQPARTDVVAGLAPEVDRNVFLYLPQIIDA